MGTLTVKDFSAGWCPSDDAVNGRKNGLLQMDSVELDKNGALALCNGTINWSTNTYLYRAHTIDAKFLAGSRYQYAALIDGSVYRETGGLKTQIITGGSTAKAAFVAAFNYIFAFSGNKRVRDDGTNITNLGLATPAVPTTTSSGAAASGNLTGTYQYAQMNVLNPGSGYVVKSPLSPLTTALVLVGQNVSVTPIAPTSNANEVWIFRRGGNLDTFYRISRITANYSNTFIDSTSDLDAIAANETANQFLSNVDSTGIPEEILCVVGLIFGRMIYITSKSIYFSIINSPDTFDTRTTIGYGSSQNTGSETLLWAKKIGESTCIIGTTQDIYILTGTFVSLPDGTLDIYLRPMSVPEPPISLDACTYQSQLIYMCALGWKVVSLDGSSQTLCSPNTDILYRGEARYGYGGVPTYIYPNTDAAGNTVRFPCCVSKNKLWCSVPYIVNNSINTAFQYRLEVYDFVRKYWRVMHISPLLLIAEQDEAITGFFDDTLGKNLRMVDAPPIGGITKTFNGANQSLNVLTSVFDNAEPFHRKDCFTLKLRINTGGTAVTFNIFTDLADALTETPGFTMPINTTVLTELILDISTAIQKAKTFQFNFTGTPIEFLLDDITIEYNSRPLQLTYLYSLPTNFGTSARKRIPGVSFELDTIGTDFTFIPILDGIAQTPLTVNSTEKKTFQYLFSTDTIIRDFNFKIPFVPTSSNGGPGSGTRVTDDFNRSDSVVLTNWANLGAVVTQVSNRAQITAGGLGFVYLPTFGAPQNYFVQITYKSVGSGTFFEYGVVGYISGTSVNHRNGYCLTFGQTFSGRFLRIYRINGSNSDFVPATVTILAELAYDYVINDVFKLIIQTSADNLTVSLTGLVNDVQKLFVNDTGPFILPNGGYAGLAAVTIDNAKVNFDDFVAQTLDYAAPTDATSVSNPVFEFYDIRPSSKIEVLPEQVQYTLVPVTNFGIANKKRVRVWPFVLDTLTGDVTVTSYVDGVAQDSIIVNQSKATAFYFFNTDVFGVDYSLEFSSDMPFELYETMKPEIVQVLPMAKQYDQVGPLHLFKHAKLRKMVFRILAYGGTTIPYKVYFSDSQVQSGDLNVSDGKETVCDVDFAKTVAGSVLRVELGPTNFNFHRFDTSALCVKSGRDTNEEWIPLDPIEA